MTEGLGTLCAEDQKLQTANLRPAEALWQAVLIRKISKVYMAAAEANQTPPGLPVKTLNSR